MSKAKGESLRDKVDGNELDLSLSNLTEVPVKELVSDNVHDSKDIGILWYSKKKKRKKEEKTLYQKKNVSKYNYSKENACKTSLK